MSDGRATDMDIVVDAPIIGGDGSAWMKEWHRKRNAAVADLLRSQPLTITDATTTEQRNDEFARHAIVQVRSASAMRPAQRMDSDDAVLYEAVVRAIREGRDDERKRFSRAVGKALQMFLGDDFDTVMFDIAQEHNINIGYDG